MKFLVLSLFTIVFVNVYSQKTLRYSGDFYNGMKINAHANYSYYENNNKRVKNGSFRYSAREKTDKYRYSSSITGNYINNLRQGHWTYTIESKDYEKSKDGFYYNVSISLSANYTNGKADGIWHFKTIRSQHKKEKRQNRWRNVGDTIVENINIDLHWKKGVLIDTIKIDNINGEHIFVVMDKNAYLISTSIIENNSSIVNKYINGILTSTIKNGTNIPDYEYIAFEKLKGNKTFIKKRKRSLINKENCIISKYIISYIFENPQLLYKYIDGDLTIRKSKTGQTSTSLKGLYYFDLSPILTPKEQVILKEFQVRYGNIKQAEWLVKTKLKKFPKDKTLLADQRRIKNALSVYRNIDCQLKAYKKYLSLHNIINNSYCTNINSNPEIESKLDYLEELKTITDKQYKILEVNHQI